MTRRVRKAIFPVGGLGTRFLPATKAMPKEMLPVVDKPLIQYAVEEAQAAGIEQFIFVTGRGKSAIEDHFDRSAELEQSLAERDKRAELRALRRWIPDPGAVAYTRQQEPLGLGHAVWCARDIVGDEPFAVLLADDLILGKTPCLKQMLDIYPRVGGNLIAVMDVPLEQTRRYGILEAGAAAGRLVEVKGLVEKPAAEQAPSTLAVVGRYVLDPAVFEHLDRRTRGAGGEIQLTDALLPLIGRGPFHGFRFKGRRFDCGDKLGFFEANLAFALARADIGRDVRKILRNYVPSDIVGRGKARGPDERGVKAPRD
ncbi:MAG: UTP--glucose-1-phosphate uridylyltransferase GalU [Pseudomonadota bacterium]